jgi:hypothetical protein
MATSTIRGRFTFNPHPHGTRMRWSPTVTPKKGHSSSLQQRSRWADAADAYHALYSSLLRVGRVERSHPPAAHPRCPAWHVGQSPPAVDGGGMTCTQLGPRHALTRLATPTRHCQATGCRTMTSNVRLLYKRPRAETPTLKA